MLRESGLKQLLHHWCARILRIQCLTVQSLLTDRLCRWRFIGIGLGDPLNIRFHWVLIFLDV